MIWDVTADDLERIAIGAGILGAGGGGNPAQGKLIALRELEAGRRLRVVSLDELPDDALAVPVWSMGAPTVSLEKPGRGDEAAIAARVVADRCGVTLSAVAPLEMGGVNSVIPLITGGQLGLPTLDVDGMGRAFPQTSMVSYYFDGQAAPLAVMVDARLRQITFEGIDGTLEMERICRATIEQLGGTVRVADTPITVGRLREAGIPGTLSLARRLGDAVLGAQGGGGDPVDGILRETGGIRLFAGKVADVDRRVERGYNFGRVRVAGTDAWAGSTAEIDVQNEFLILRVDGEVRATVPDLITLVDSERGFPITTEVIRYGLRVQVLGLPAATRMTTPGALRWVGPRAFRYDLDFQPLPRKLSTR